MKTYLFILILTITSTLYCTEMNHKGYTKLIEATIIQTDSQSVSVANDNHKIDAIPTILHDGSIKMELVVWEKN